MNDNEVRDKLIEDLSFISQMSVQEYTLYRKWCEIKERYPITITKSLLGTEISYPYQKDMIRIKSNIWIPKNPNDYLSLQPKLVECDSKNVSDWNILRTIISTMLNNPNIGRNMYFMVVDEVTNKYLGVIQITGDFLDLTPRDSYIGWSREIKTQGHMINHSAIGSSIVPTQPLGYSYVGGKLLALLVLSNVIQDRWKSKYNDILVSITTTSLYGSFSQYNNLSPWVKRGHSAGSIKFEPHRNTVIMVKEWLKEHHNQRYLEWYVIKNSKGQPFKRDHKQRSLVFTYTKLGIPKELYETAHSRGIYYTTFYENSREFLRKEIDESGLGKKRFNDSVEYLTNLWKTKHAAKRLKSLQEKGIYNTNTLCYDSMIGLSWEETKEKYLGDVGR
jgi:hypothetical protein